MRNITIRTKVRALLEELDKIDPVWYNAEALGSIENSEAVYIACGGRTNPIHSNTCCTTLFHTSP